MKNFIAVFIGVIVFGSSTSCALFQKLQESATGCLHRGSVISIDIPPITLTPARTAAERQLIGEDQELEKDGWLIASSRSRPPDLGKTGGTAADQARQRLREEAVLEFYDEMVKDFRGAGVLGEDAQGRLILVPEDISPRTGRFRSREEIEAVLRVALEVNRSRDWLAENGPPEEASRTRSRYQERLRSGEWFRDNKGVWKRR